MHRGTAPVIVLHGLSAVAVASCSATPVAPLPTARAHPIPFRSTYSADAYEFLRAYVGERSIVQLGESIHVTAEFPRVRLHLVRYLHEALGFDVLALEGSLLASWLAQEHLYRSSDPLPAKLARAQELAWFGLWQTQPMLEVMEYVAQTQRTRSPLYLASFDIQPGASRAFGGSGDEALAALFEALRKYRPASDEAAPTRWRAALSPFLHCFRSPGSDTTRDRRLASTAIEELERWIVEVAPLVGSANSPAHAAALRELPNSLRGSIELCENATRSGDTRTYQETRDRINAANALVLRDKVSSAHRVLLWAHHSHVHHNSTGGAVPSMGQRLMETSKGQLYTIGVFAGGGRALEVSDDTFPPVVPRELRPGSSYGLEGLLGRMRGDDYFVDFSTMAAADSASAPWFSELTSRTEPRGGMRVRPAEDFHAAVFVREVEPAPLSMLPSAMAMGLTLYGAVLDHPVLALVGLTLSIAAVVRWWLRKRGLPT